MSFAAVLERLQTVENPYPGLRPFETSKRICSLDGMNK